MERADGYRVCRVKSIFFQLAAICAQSIGKKQCVQAKVVNARAFSGAGVKCIHVGRSPLTLAFSTYVRLGR
jgi:hypothetical protein